MADQVFAAVEPFRQELLRRADDFYLFLNPQIAKLEGGVPTKDWLFVPADQALGAAALYLLFVFVGTLIMKNRKNPIDLSAIKYFYNPVQVIVCSWMFIEAGRQAYMKGYALLRNPHNLQDLDIARVLYVFYLTKILDFLDTVFIIFHQKWKQLTFLHVYHHTSIFLTYWFIMNAGYDGDVYATVVLNGFVHAVMYMYYMITSLNLLEPVRTYSGKELYTKNNVLIPESASGYDARKKVTVGKRYSPSWKRFITYVQMIQFILMNVQGYFMLFENDGLPEAQRYPKNIALWYLVYIQSMFWLFLNFALGAYCRGGKKKSKSKKN